MQPEVGNDKRHVVSVHDRVQAAAAADTEHQSTPLWRRRYARSLVLADLVSIVVAVSLAQWIRFGGSQLDYSAYTEISIGIGVLWLGALYVNHSRSPRVIGSGVEEYRRVWLGTIAVFGAVAIISMMFKLELARGYLMIALPAGLALLILFRSAARLVIARERKKYGHCVTRVLVVGCHAAARELAVALSRDPTCGYQIVGAYVSDLSQKAVFEVPGAGAVPTFSDDKSIIEAVASTKSHVVAVAANDRLHGRSMRDLSWELEKFDIDLLVAPGVVDVAGPRLHMRPVAGLPLIHVEKPAYHGAKRFQKRLFDVVFSGLVLLVGLPALVAIALAVKLTSNGPVFYRQERIGLDGKPFEIIKFRTMVNGADSMLADLIDLNEFRGGVLFKMRNDPRITPVGRTLRRFSLDEIPQFINVLKGEMSVVGPRPPLPNEVESYDHHTMRRLLVRPGITGLWQVSGRSDLSWDDSVRLDLYYVENWSMMADLVIALKTARVVFSRNGAY
jgi:exopolysaccharide biosynthesis polyprenyl glycosylphosphotransferase